MPLFWKLLHEEEAATAVEYAVMLAMVLMTVIGTVGVVGAQSGGMWGGIESDLDSVGFGGTGGSPPPSP
jgi:Flp pilus assembly pilin Flp